MIARRRAPRDGSSTVARIAADGSSNVHTVRATAAPALPASAGNRTKVGLVGSMTPAVLTRQVSPGNQVLRRHALPPQVGSISRGSARVRRAPEMIRGRWVTDAEKHHTRLSGEFYSTYGFVTHVEDNNGLAAPTTGRKRIIDPAWHTKWREYDQLWSAASRANNYANHQSVGHDWEQFAPGTPLDVKRAELVAAGGLLTREQQGPGPIPMQAHPDEVAVDQFLARADAAYQAWLPNPINATRGPSDGGRLSAAQVQLLGARRNLGRGWSFANSFTGGVAVHHAGPHGAPTFIYHVLSTH